MVPVILKPQRPVRSRLTSLIGRRYSRVSIEVMRYQTMTATMMTRNSYLQFSKQSFMGNKPGFRDWVVKTNRRLIGCSLPSRTFWAAAEVQVKMAPLKQLEKENPIIDASFRDFCASHGILTVEDFLVHDLYELAAFAQRHTNADRLKEGITLMLSFIELQSRPWLNGMELLEDLQRNKLILSTGDKGTDSLLQGGFREGQLTELVGPSSSGKTQFCLQAAASVAENHLGRVLYLDTGNSFSARRIAQFICSSSDPALGQKVMSRISCHAVYDIYTMFETLQGLEVTLRSQVHKNVNDYRLRLLVVDSISSLITPILGGSGSQGRALMVAVGYLLKKLAHEHSIAILVTNHTVGAGGEGGKTKPALGETWKSIPHVRLMLSRDHRNSNCNISILKHTFMPSGQAVRIMTCKNNQPCL